MSEMTLFGMRQSTHCGICGRELTDPVSVARGIGPICWFDQLREKEAMNEEDYHDEHIPEPITSGVIMRRGEGGTATNVPHVVCHHSPSGYEWGYAGSGPADLALNICEVAVQQLGYDGPMIACWRGECSELAWAVHQEFKWRFVCDVPREGGVIPWQKVLVWVKDYTPDYLREYC